MASSEELIPHQKLAIKALLKLLLLTPTTVSIRGDRYKYIT
jgi:hypothetical protein